MSDAFANDPFGNSPYGDNQTFGGGGGFGPGGGALAGGDPWDFGGNDNYNTLADPTVGNMGFEDYSDLIAKEKSGPSILVILLVLVLLGAAGYLGWEFYQTGKNPFAGIVNSLEQMYAEFVGSSTNVNPPPKRSRQKSRTIATNEPAPLLNLDAIAPPPNPYWELPNRIVNVARPQARGWSPEEEEGFRLGLGSRYTYQRYKAVQEVRVARLRGSESILWDALAEPKLWTRMWAVVGLAEFGIEISVDTVERAIGSERSELVANFFKRFIEENNSGSLYVLRQALKLVDDRSRVIIHRALWRAGKRNPYRNLYIVAATYDPGPRVQKFARQILRRRPMSEAEFIQHQRVVLGIDKAKDLIPVAAELQQVSPPVATPPEEPLDSVPTNTSHPPTPVEVAPDVPANDAGDEYDDAVEFYDMVTDGEAEGTEVERPAALKDTFDL